MIVPTTNPGHIRSMSLFFFPFGNKIHVTLIQHIIFKSFKAKGKFGRQIKAINAQKGKEKLKIHSSFE